MTFEEQFHGTSLSEGRVKVGFPNYFYEQSELWRRATGFVNSPDLSNGSPQGTVGVSPNSLDPHNNTRYRFLMQFLLTILIFSSPSCSSVCAYYIPYAARPNLKVITGSTVTKILWEDRSTSALPLRATGVQITQNVHNAKTIKAAREVILAAGTIGSPKVLELSGVGNKT